MYPEQVRDRVPDQQGDILFNNTIYVSNFFGLWKYPSYANMYILCFVFFGIAAWCAQLKTDVTRIIDTLYGVEGSDESISIWKSAPLMYKTKPPFLQFRASTQMGRKFYFHGGVDCDVARANPSDD